NQKAIIWAGGIDTATWGTMVPVIRPYYDTGNVLGFYMADDAWGVSQAEASREMQMIKADFPLAVTLAVFRTPRDLVHFAPNDVLGSMPPELDWAGVEMYQDTGNGEPSDSNPAF